MLGPHAKDTLCGVESRSQDQDIEVFELDANFMSIPVMHKIGAAEDLKISRHGFNTLSKVNRRTLGPTKHLQVMQQNLSLVQFSI
jgi:hypothetical protein